MSWYLSFLVLISENLIVGFGEYHLGQYKTYHLIQYCWHWYVLKKIIPIKLLKHSFVIIKRDHKTQQKALYTGVKQILKFFPINGLDVHVDLITFICGNKECCHFLFIKINKMRYDSLRDNYPPNLNEKEENSYKQQYCLHKWGKPIPYCWP